MKQSLALALLLGSASLGVFVGCEPKTQTQPPQRPTQTEPLASFALLHPTGPVLLGGNVIGQLAEKKDAAEAKTASDQSKKSPATPAMARQAITADLNDDGFVTLDEVTALHDAAFDDHQILKRLQATGQVFDLTAEQEDYLVNNGVRRAIVDRLRAHEAQ